MTTPGVPVAALAAIWERHSEVVRGRLDAIDRAAVPGAAPDLRAEGARAAHQLAGTVGTFGFADATEIARELEARLGPAEAAAGAGARGEAGAAELPALARSLRRELAREVAGLPSRDTPSGRPAARVLAVDDDPLILDSLRSLLADRELEVVTEADSSRVVACLRELAPDLLIVDVEMPILDGIELCRRIRADPLHHALRIVFLTTHTDTETVRAAYLAGADGHVSKPVVVTELLACIEQQLSGARDPAASVRLA